MLDESLENLKVKPLPKKENKYNFFIEKQADSKLPSVIDKTKEQLINYQDFMAKISNNLNIFNKDIVIKKPFTEKPFTEKPFTEKPFTEKPFTKKPIHDKQGIITNIEKTTKKIIIKEKQIDPDKPNKPGQPDKPNKPINPKKLADIDTEATVISKSEYKKTKFIHDEDIDKGKILGDANYGDRLPNKLPNILIKASSYYLYNRENHINFINTLFLPYKEELLKEEKDIAEGKISVNCADSLKKEFSLLTHQKIVRDYLNLYTPYRGLLLYHGLGSGKTCSSIAITEGLKNDKQILIMTPASLKDNYIEELKKCGDYLYKKINFGNL